MSKLLFGKINLSKIDKTKLFAGEKGIWMDLTIWLKADAIMIQTREATGYKLKYIPSALSFSSELDEQMKKLFSSINN